MSRRNNSAPARLRQDYLNLKKDPVPYIVAEPLPSNILEWRYIVDGPENTPYFGGVYQGKLVFPVEYPFKPPAIYMITLNGRFHVNTRLCLTMSDYHPETWNPSWSVGSILNGLLSFMVGSDYTLGAIWNSTDALKTQFAKESLSSNLADSVFCDLFPEKVEEIRNRISTANQIQQQQASAVTWTESASSLQNVLAQLQLNDFLFIVVSCCLIVILYAIVMYA